MVVAGTTNTVRYIHSTKNIPDPSTTVGMTEKGMDPRCRTVFGSRMTKKESYAGVRYLFNSASNSFLLIVAPPMAKSAPP